MKIKKTYLKILLATLAIVSVFTYSAYSNNPTTPETYSKIKVLMNAIDIIDQSYVDPVDMGKLVTSALNGMMRELDPHSAYMLPEVKKEFEVQMKGSFGGIGTEIGIKDGELIVVASIEDTPAYKAGVKAGDKIVSINCKPTKDITITDAVNNLRGPEGTIVTIGIRREGEANIFIFTLTRATIKIKSVRHQVFSGNIGYIRLAVFREHVAQDIRKAIQAINTQTQNDTKGIILDLRNNPGGLLDEGRDVSDVFLTNGMIVFTKGRTPQSNLNFYAKDSHDEPTCPMVVLVDEGSASASEIVAGALQDHKRAVVVGMQTFGKGSVQTKFDLSDGSAIKITTAKYYTPSGRCIQAEGITPDIAVKFVPFAGKNATRLVREKDIDGHMKSPIEGKKTQEREVELEQDNQLKAAVDIIKSWALFKK